MEPLHQGTGDAALASRHPGDGKSASALRTIGEVSDMTGVAQHVLRYWEGRFTQLRPVQRAGRRRYYRPDDVALVMRIKSLIDEQGYTIKGVQRLLASARRNATPSSVPAIPDAAPAAHAPPFKPSGMAADDVARLQALRNRLASILAETAPA